MRNVQTKILKCQNVEHHCENCGNKSKNSEKRVIESEVVREKQQQNRQQWDFHSHDDGMAKNYEINQVPGVISLLDQLQSIGYCFATTGWCNKKWINNNISRQCQQQ